MANVANQQTLDSLPNSLSKKDLRACMICSMIKTTEQFKRAGCDNCERYVSFVENSQFVYDCTSANFEGFMVVVDPQKSWVSRWQRIGDYVPGAYAISVTGTPPRYIIDMLRNKGVPYHLKDKTVSTSSLPKY